MIQIVTVVNNHELYDTVIRKNPLMNRFPLHLYDNGKENTGIATRYNDFIRNHMHQDAWVVFCHQDFYFTTDVEGKIEGLDRGCIYGPTGIGPARSFIGVFSISRFGIDRMRIGFAKRSVKLGRILQKTPRKSRYLGRKLRRPEVVDTVDCCCLIVHASLINRFRLTFDERFQWHCYAEDFSLNARYNHSIETKAVQLDSVHMSAGTPSFGFMHDLLQLQTKYHTTDFATTIFDGHERF